MQDILSFIHNHLALTSLLAVVLIGLIIVEFIKLRRGTHQLSPARAVQLMNHNKAVVLDIRGSETFLAGHIVGAISLPLSEINTKLKKIEKFKSQPIVITCATGMDSQKAAALLNQQGFQTYILAGGMRAWRDAEMPIVKG